MFRLLENAVLPKEIIKGLLYELYPSNYISIRPQTSAVIPFSIQLNIPEDSIGTLEILPEFTLKGLIAPNVSFINGEILQLPVFYSFFPLSRNVLDELFARNIIFIEQKKPIAKLWIKKA